MVAGQEIVGRNVVGVPWPDSVTIGDRVALS